MRKILLLLLILSGTRLMAQQNAHYTQYVFNGLVINPAYAGSKGVLQVSGIYRNQWSGLEGSPRTQTISLDGSVIRDRVGLGLHVINDELGAQGQKSVFASSSFRINLNETSHLALGLAGGVTEYFLDGTRLHPIDRQNDPTIPDARLSNVAPDAKAGLFFNTEKLYVGLSVANLVGFKNKFVVTPIRHYFLTAGYIFDLNEYLKFKPSFLWKEDFKGPANLDLNAFLLVGDRIWLGGSYRSGVKLFNQNSAEAGDLDSNNAWALITEIYLSPKIKIGYSHDVTLTSLRDYGSHELSVGFYFFKKQDSRNLTIRYF